MKITDGSNRVIGTYCGQQTGRSVLVNDTVAVLTFKTDRSVHSSGFHLSFSFFPNGKLGRYFRTSCSSMRAGMRTLEFFRPPFSVGGPYLVDSLSNTWINGMLMQMLDPAFILHGSNIQADYASNPKVTPFLQF